MSISRFDLERSISDLEGKNSKIRLLEALRMATKNICVRFHGFPVKTVGGDRFLVKKVPKNGTLIALAVEPVDLLTF